MALKSTAITQVIAALAQLKSTAPPGQATIYAALIAGFTNLDIEISQSRMPSDPPPPSAI